MWAEKWILFTSPHQTPWQNTSGSSLLKNLQRLKNSLQPKLRLWLCDSLHVLFIFTAEATTTFSCNKTRKWNQNLEKVAIKVYPPVHFGVVHTAKTANERTNRCPFIMPSYFVVSHLSWLMTMTDRRPRSARSINMRGDSFLMKTITLRKLHLLFGIPGDRIAYLHRLMHKTIRFWTNKIQRCERFRRICLIL